MGFTGFEGNFKACDGFSSTFMSLYLMFGYVCHTTKAFVWRPYGPCIGLRALFPRVISSRINDSHWVNFRSPREIELRCRGKQLCRIAPKLTASFRVVTLCSGKTRARIAYVMWRLFLRWPRQRLRQRRRRRARPDIHYKTEENVSGRLIISSDFSSPPARIGLVVVVVVVGVLVLLPSEEKKSRPKGGSRDGLNSEREPHVSAINGKLETNPTRYRVENAMTLEWMSRTGAWVLSRRFSTGVRKRWLIVCEAYGNTTDWVSSL